MRTRSRLFEGLALAALMIGAAACSSSSSPSGNSGGQSTGTAAKADIAAAYETLFNLSNPALDPKVAVIQNGPALRASLATALKSPLAKLAGGAKILKTTPLTNSACSNEALPSPCQSVRFDIVSTKGKTLVGENGFAIYSGGKWLVAKVTICGLLSLAGGGTAPAGC